MLRIIGCVTCTVFVLAGLGNMVAFAEQSSATNTLTVVAEVRPQRIIVVNDALEITKIYSNTAEDVRPTVYLDDVSGKELPYSDSIVDEYQTLVPSLDTSEPGVLYEKKSNPVAAFFASVWHGLQGLVDWFSIT